MICVIIVLELRCEDYNIDVERPKLIQLYYVLSLKIFFKL